MLFITLILTAVVGLLKIADVLTDDAKQKKGIKIVEIAVFFTILGLNLSKLFV